VEVEVSVADDALTVVMFIPRVLGTWGVVLEVTYKLIPKLKLQVYVCRLTLDL
jgi:hypothetical protein